jgi:hypothetical protein
MTVMSGGRFLIEIFIGILIIQDALEIFDLLINTSVNLTQLLR